MSARWADVHASAKPDGARKPQHADESVRNFTVRSAVQTDAGWQAGAELQLADRSKTGKQSTNLSEFNVDVGYRTGAALNYAQLTVPVSRSAYEMEDTYQLDALGRGFWGVGLGQLWTVDLGATTLFVTYEGHRSWPRAFANDQNAGRLVPGFGLNWAVGVNEKLGRFTLGATLAQSYEDPVEIDGDRSRKNGSAQRFFTPTLSAAADLGEGWGVAVTYADQTIMPAATADLTREAGVVVNKLF